MTAKQTMSVEHWTLRIIMDFFLECIMRDVDDIFGIIINIIIIISM